MKNNINNLFEIATKEKYRYIFKGVLTTEDLWDLNLDDLDSIHNHLSNEIERKEKYRLLCSTNFSKIKKEVQELRNKAEIIVEIYNIKLKEQAEKELEIIREDEIKLIKDILNEKKKEELSNMTQEQLYERLSELTYKDDEGIEIINDQQISFDKESYEKKKRKFLKACAKKSQINDEENGDI